MEVARAESEAAVKAAAKVAGRAVDRAVEVAMPTALDEAEEVGATAEAEEAGAMVEDEETITTAGETADAAEEAGALKARHPRRTPPERGGKRSR